MQNEPTAELVEIAARALCRAPGSLCVGFCHARRCRQAVQQYGDAVRAVLAAVTPQIEARAVGEIAKRFDHIRSDLNNISRAIEDEGDRCYLGSTNDADELRRIAQEFEDWLLSRERSEYSKENKP